MSKLIFILFLALPAFAERAGGNNNLQVSIFAGFSFANNKGEALDGRLDSTTGIAWGLGVDYRLLPNMFLEIDILNVEKNYDMTTSDGTRQSYKVSFLEIPVLVRVILSKEFHFKFGPYLSGLLTSASRESGGSDDPIKGEFRNDYGITAGFWLGFPVKKSWYLGLDARYDFGMADIQKDNLPASRILTRAFITSLVLTFTFK